MNEDEAEDGTADRLLWTALVAGFALSTIIGGLLYSGMIARVDHAEEAGDRADANLRVHESTAGHPAALSQIEAHRDETDSLFEAHYEVHRQLDSRLNRIEDALDGLRRKTGGKPLFHEEEDQNLADRERRAP